MRFWRSEWIWEGFCWERVRRWVEKWGIWGIGGEERIWAGKGLNCKLFRKSEVIRKSVFRKCEISLGTGLGFGDSDLRLWKRGVEKWEMSRDLLGEGLWRSWWRFGRALWVK